jgi:N-hydroxyarylamine O-acetyltransferase
MRFIDVGGELTLQSKLGDKWAHVYRVIPYPRYDGEYEITNWYTSTHPDAPYLSNMIAARPGPDRSRITLFNARVIVRHSDGRSERRTLDGIDEYRSVLREEFGLNVSDEDLAMMLEIVERRGAKGAPHPFFS